MQHRALVVVMVCAGIMACGAPPSAAPALVGTWRATSSNAAGTSFEFHDDGTATWNLGQPFEIQYGTGGGEPPTHLDLFGFQAGPLEGRTLFCLIEVTEPTLRMDCEPTDRPAQFDEEQTQVFERVPGGMPG